MRIASFTIVKSQEETNDVPTFATTTYYSITQDGDSTTLASEFKKKDIIVNAGLEFLWDVQELGFPQAKAYLDQIYKDLLKHKYHIQLTDILPSAPVRHASPLTGVPVVTKTPLITKKAKTTKDKKNTIDSPLVTKKKNTPSTSTPIKDESLRAVKRQAVAY